MLALCKHVANRATAVFVGPNSLLPRSEASLRAAGAVLLGGRAYSAVPCYMQHADILVVPHRVSPFTESLDPIKVRELLAVGRPTWDPGGRLPGCRAARSGGPGLAVRRGGRPGLLGPAVPPGPGPLLEPLPTWADTARQFLDVLDRAAKAGMGSVGPTAAV